MQGSLRLPATWALALALVGAVCAPGPLAAPRGAGTPAGIHGAARCLDASSASTVVVPDVEPSAANKIRGIRASQVYDFRGLTLNANPPKYPVVFHEPDGLCVTGIKAVGGQPNSLTWREMKNAKYGGILFKNAKGTVTVEHFFFDHLMDGFMPRSVNNSSWILRHGYMRRIRDDAIENDNCQPGLVEDVLVDGAFMFLSVRPGAASDNACRGQQAGNIVTIRGTLARLECQPHAGEGTRREEFRQSCPENPDMGVGQLFKMARGGAGAVDVADSVFLVPSLSVNGAKAMNFPPGVYERVTLVWLGGGRYPGDLPPSGVTVTTDPSVWGDARAEWLKRHDCDSAPDSCSFLKR